MLSVVFRLNSFAILYIAVPSRLLWKLVELGKTNVILMGSQIPANSRIYFLVKIYKTTKGIIIGHDEKYFLSKEPDWDGFINRENLFEKVSSELGHLKADDDLFDLLKSGLLAPIGSQEVWAAGVTYLRSREARMEEAKDAGGSDFYARVYEAERPELFFKATAYRTVGLNQSVRIRKDSKWNVPEPELTLFI